jgi:phenylacetate-CoA ligase
VFGSEIWTRQTKKKMASLWDLEPYDIYGFTELYGPGVGNDCHVHDGLHIWQDYFLVEVVDPKTGDLLGPEEEGELVFTTLGKEAMPLLRYRSGDISFLMDSSSCDCGRTHQRFGEIKARADDMLKVSGVNFWPSQVETVLLKEVEFGPEYQIRVVRQNSIDRMSIVVESRDKGLDGEKRGELARKLGSELHDILLFTPDISIVNPNTLPRVETGKAKRVFDERSS